MLKNSDVYIEILEFAQSRGMRGICYKDFSNKFGKYKDAVWLSVVGDGSFTSLHTHDVGVGIYSNYFVLSCKARFRLLEFQKLEEEKRSTRSAIKLSFLAIFVSLVSTVISIWIGKAQLENHVKIDPEQVSILVKSMQKSSLASTEFQRSGAITKTAVTPNIEVKE